MWQFLLATPIFPWIGCLWKWTVFQSNDQYCLLTFFFYIHDIFWKLFFALLTIRESVIAECIQLYHSYIFAPRHWNVINVNWQWREKKYWCLIADYYKLIKYNYHFFYCLVSRAMNYPKGSSNQLYWSP